MPPFAEVAGLDSPQNGTTGLLRMRAIGKAAVDGKLVNIREAVLEPATCAEETQLAHARCVHQQGTVVEHKQLPARCRVNAFSRFADGLRVKCLLTKQPVDEAGLADAGGPQQAERSAGHEDATKFLQSVAVVLLRGRI